MNKSNGNKIITKHWAGLDVSKDTFDAGLVLNGELGDTPKLRDIAAGRFARSPQGVDAFVAWLDESRGEIEGAVRCVMETTGRYSTELAIWLIEARPALAPAIVHAKHASEFIKSLGMRNHTDALAARALALFGLQRQPNAYEPPSKNERKLREVCRLRHSLVAQRTAMKNQAQESTESAYVVRAIKTMISHFTRKIMQAQAEMKRLVAAMPAVREDVARFETIYGVGFITATVVRAELGDLDRFGEARQLSAHAGLNPCVRQSGTSVHPKTRMSKQGNPRVRQALYMAATTAVRGDNDFAHDYHRLLERGKAHKAALGAVMRKMLLVMRTLKIHKTIYEPKRKNKGRRCGKPCGKLMVDQIVAKTAEALSV